MESTLNLIKDTVFNSHSTPGTVCNVNNTERVISLVAGALLTYYGLKKKHSLLGKGLSMAGGLLITRGSSGYCPVNSMIGRS
jgi:uncharacterized membrane protein